MAGFFSDEAGQARTKALNEGLGSIGELFRYYLGPTGVPTKANQAAGVIDMVSPSSAAYRSMGAARDGRYAESMVEVAGVLIPAGIVYKYGAKTALAAAQGLSETLAGTAGGMRGLSEAAYEKFIARMNQPGPAPDVVGSNLGNVGRGSPHQSGQAPSLNVAPNSGRRAPNTRSKTIEMPDGTRIPRPKTMAEVPDIRNMSVEDALFVARQEPHIISGGESSRGGFIGGPENIKNRRNLTKQREAMDAQIDAGAAGGDWYDRYRRSVEDVTNDASDATWMSNIEGQYSAGVSPESELAYSIKDTNSAIATGADPDAMVKAARPAQKEASIRAIEANDPSALQLGPKTGAYAGKINPKAAADKTATGVNDFRHARTLGFTEPDGTPQRGALGEQSHTYSDYETALSVDRANQRILAGRADWTGEQVQAAPWVKQKADDFYERQRASYDNKAVEELSGTGSNMSPDEIERVGREIAFREATRTIGDFYPKHTAFATYEAQPYVSAGHLSGLARASQDERASFANMPESTWANTGGRDDIYANTRLGDTGYAVRTLPTTEMQGVYTPPSGVTEYNPGEVARPLVAFDTGKAKSVPDHDRAILDAGEATRAFIDAQGAGAWHKPWVGGQTGLSNSISGSFNNPRPLTQSELGALGEIGARYGLPDVVDTGQGATLHDFAADVIPKRSAKDQQALEAELEPFNFDQVNRAKVDSGYLGFEDAWEAGVGSGEATKNLLSILDSLPRGVYDAFNQNTAIAKNALQRMGRDKKLSKKYGSTREDIQNARAIVGEGAGWIDRLRKGLQGGLILPGVAAFVLAQSEPPGSHGEQF